MRAGGLAFAIADANFTVGDGELLLRIGNAPPTLNALRGGDRIAVAKRALREKLKEIDVPSKAALPAIALQSEGAQPLKREIRGTRLKAPLHGGA